MKDFLCWIGLHRWNSFLGMVRACRWCSKKQRLIYKPPTLEHSGWDGTDEVRYWEDIERGKSGG